MQALGVFPPPLEELKAYSLGKCAPGRAEEIEAFLADGPDCAGVFAAAPDDPLVRRLRRAGALPSTGQACPSSADTVELRESAPESNPLPSHPRYRVLRKLGQGGMGAVYLCEHRLMRRLVAVKLIRAERSADPQFVERFRREVQALATLSHPNIVTAHDADEADGCQILVMEYVAGESLGRRLARSGPLPLAEACDAARQAALALAFAHEKGLVHRDIKPDNLMQSADGVVKVLDFGLARIMRETAAAQDDLTGSATVVGTADYIAPEQARDSRGADIRADIYSLGCTLYHLLTGHVPFPGGTALDKVIRHATETPSAAPVAPDVERVLRKMLAKAPAERYQTPADVVQALGPFTRVQDAPPRRPVMRRWLTGAVVVGLLGVAAAVIAGRLTNNDKDELAPPPSASAVPPPPAKKPALPVAENLEILRRIPVKAPRDLFYDADVSAGGKYALITRDTQPGVQAEVYDVRSGARLFTCGAFSARFLGDGEEIVARVGNNFCVYQTQTGKLLRMTGEPHTEFYSMNVSPDGKCLSYFCEFGYVLIDLRHMKELKRFWDGRPGPAVFSPDSKYFVHRTRNSERWTAWDLEKNRPTSRFDVLNGFTTLAFFFPDGSVAVTRDSEGARIDLDSGTNRGGFLGLDAPPGQNDGFYSPTTRRVAQRYPDGRFLVYDTPFTSNTERCRFQAPTDDLGLGPTFGGGRWSTFSNDDRFAVFLTNRSLYVLGLPPLPARD